MNNQKEQLRTLYEESFNDKKEYIDYFFNVKYNAENVVTLGDDTGRIISATHIFYKKIAFNGKIYDYPFIAGAATRAELRGKGIFNNVMRNSLVRLKGERHPFVGLYPFKHSYYAKFDFATINYALNFKLENVINISDLKVKTYRDLSYLEILAPSIIKIYNECCKAYTIFQFRDKNLIRERIRELMSDNGYVVMVSKCGINIGFAMISDDNITECFFTDYIIIRGVREFLGKEICLVCGNYKDAVKIQKKLDFINSEINEYSMARIIDSEDFFNILSFKTTKKINFKVKITDSVLVDKIIEIKTENGLIRARKAEDFNYIISITELTRLVSGNDDNLDLPQEFKDIFVKENFIFVEEY